jgi:hypothetical protein
MAEETKPEVKLTLDDKILAIQDAIKKLKKTGTNKDQGYKYLTIEDAVDATRREMISHRLLLIPGKFDQPTRHDDGKGFTFTLYIEWMLKDLDSGTERTWTIPGAGWDYHDKGVAKAVTGSRKTALILIFNLPIGDNPEAGNIDRTSATDRAQGVAQRKIAASKAAKPDEQSQVRELKYWQRGEEIEVTGPSDVMNDCKSILLMAGKRIGSSAIVAVPAEKWPDMQFELEQGKGVTFKKQENVGG